jgi:hypothetical protein
MGDSFQIWVCRAAPEMQNAKCKMQNQERSGGTITAFDYGYSIQGNAFRVFDRKILP